MQFADANTFVASNGVVIVWGQTREHVELDDSNIVDIEIAVNDSFFYESTFQGYIRESIPVDDFFQQAKVVALHQSLIATAWDEWEVSLGMK